MTSLYTNKASHHVTNAQQNLMGRTHYVDPDTLRFHKSKVLYSTCADHGLLFGIVTSDALDYHNTKRGYRFSVFDVFGNVLARTELEAAFKRRDPCEKAMWAALNSIDAIAHTRAAIEQSRLNYNREMNDLHKTVDALAAKAAA